MPKAITELNISILVDGNASMADLLGECGFAALVDVYYDDDTSFRLLFDTASGTPSLTHNIKKLKLDLSTVEMIVLSHGHWDHVGGLKDVLKLTERVPVLYHPQAIEPKIFVPDEGKERDIGITNYISLEELRSSANVIETTKPYKIDEGIWSTGEVPRTNDFEKFTGNLKKIFILQDGKRIPDPIDDDLSLVFKLHDGSVVVLAGCCHSGIVNTLKHVSDITGTSAIKAVIGGLHLHDASKVRLNQTVEHLKGYPLASLSPCHCSGLRGKAALLYGFENVFKEVGSGSVLKFKSN